MDATEPYFAVGEYWDSLSYTYGEMDHNQDAHRQRIIDWINATNGSAGAFDVTTKGILHSVSVFFLCLFLLCRSFFVILDSTCWSAKLMNSESSPLSHSFLTCIILGSWGM